MILGLLQANYPIEMDKLSIGFENYAKKEREQLLYANLTSVHPLPNLEIPISYEVFKGPFHLIFALVTIILDLSDNSQI